MATVARLFLAWGGLILIHYLLTAAGLYDTGLGGEKPDHPDVFPFSVADGPTFHLLGLPAVLGFLGLLYWAVKRSDRLSGWKIWVIATALVVLGNLGQGGLDAGFLKPFTESDIQYYHAALEVRDPVAWLAAFNDRQVSLPPHTKTHPPFAVLLHHLLLDIGGRRTGLLAAVFVLFASLAFPVLQRLLEDFRLTAGRRNRMVLLFAALPAVNIYGAVCLDALVLTTATLFMLGMARLAAGCGRPGLSFSMVALGFAATNLLTYGGTFLAAVGTALGVWEMLGHRRLRSAAAMAGALLFFLLIILAMDRYWQYDHIRGFLTASRIENPSGFRGLAEPAVYLMTRVENVCEIAIFFSFGALAILFHPHRLNLRLTDWHRHRIRLMITGVGVLALMFAAGAYKTGETARGCLFIYPYLILALTAVDRKVLEGLIVFAGLQTAAMQATLEFFW